MQNLRESDKPHRAKTNSEVAMGDGVFNCEILLEMEKR